MRPDGRQDVIRQFAHLCTRDSRVSAAFLGGSFAAGKADNHSDLDLYLITTEAGYDSLFADRRALLRQLGEPVLLEDFNGFGFDMVVFLFRDGVEGELALGRESRFDHLHGGPFTVLVDKKGLLTRKVFPYTAPTEEEQRETLRHLIHWFWRDVSLFVTAMAREQWWSAYGHLERLRVACLDLACLNEDFSSWPGGYEKVERAVRESTLASLRETFAAPECRALQEAANNLIRFHQDAAHALAAHHDVPYPDDLEETVLNRFESGFTLS